MSEKSEFVKAVALESGLTQAVVDQAMRGVAKEVHRRIAAGQSVRVFGLGKFHVVYRKARVGRSNMLHANDGKGVPINIPARKSVKFKPLPTLFAAALGE